MANSRKTKQNAKLIRQLFNDNITDVDRYSLFFGDDVKLYGPASGQEVQGLARLVEIDAVYAKAFTQIKVRIEQLFAFGDIVTIRWTITGKHIGTFFDVGPRNKKFSVSGQTMYKVSRGKIREIWQSWDRLGLLEQIGEVSVKPNSIDSESQQELLRKLGMEKYIEKVPRLSDRERQCLKKLLDGKTAKETADDLKLSYRTVEYYFENIKNKLDCWTKKDLFRAAQLFVKVGLL